MGAETGASGCVGPIPKVTYDNGVATLLLRVERGQCGGGIVSLLHQNRALPAGDLSDRTARG